MTGENGGVKRLEDINQAAEAFEAAFNSGNLEGAVGLYSEDAVLIPSPGHEARGREAIRQALGGMIAMNGRMNLTILSSLQVSDVSCRSYEWQLQGTAPNGEPVSLQGRGAIVHRRQPDGGWLAVIDNPFAFT